jgi:hypothetical protein
MATAAKECDCTAQEATLKRRKRSHMTEADCLESLRCFSGRVERMLTGSHGIEPHTFAPDGQVTVAFSVCGSFGVADDLFEAVRVLGGHKLPAKS